MPEEFQPQMSSMPVYNGSPYFMGDHSLVTFSTGEDSSGPKTYWLVDKKDHTIRPFESETALKNAFGEGFSTAMQHIVTIVPPNVDEEGLVTDGVLKDFDILSADYSIREDGTGKKLPFSAHKLRTRGGKAINEKGEGMAVEILDGFLNKLKQSSSQTGIQPGFIDKLKQDSKLMAYYVSSLAYDNATLSDIYKDISERNQEESNEPKQNQYGNSSL